MGGFAGGQDTSGVTYNDPPALETVQDYMGDARTLLLDQVPPYRYDDNSLVQSLNVCMMRARGLRPDLFLGDLVETYFNQVGMFSVGSVTRVVPVEYPFRLAILYGMIGHALARDQEDVQDARSTTYIQISDAMLMTGTVGLGSA